MNILRKPIKNIASFVRICESKEVINDMIVALSLVSDVYIYIDKKCSINPLKYSHLLPIHGYSTGSKTEVDSYMELIKYVHITSPYKMYVIPDEVDKNYSYLNDLLYTSDGISQSVMEVGRRNFSEIESEYTKPDWWSIDRWREDIYGMYSTHECYSDIVMNYRFIEELMKLCEDSTYIRSFKFTYIDIFIASSLIKSECKFMNTNPRDIYPLT